MEKSPWVHTDVVLPKLFDFGIEKRSAPVLVLTPDQIPMVAYLYQKLGSIEFGWRDLDGGFLTRKVLCWMKIPRASGVISQTGELKTEREDKMPTDVCQILEDPRPIVVVENHSGKKERVWVLGRDGVEKITAYAEPGEFCPRPWIAIWKHGKVETRLSVDGCTLYYD